MLEWEEWIVRGPARRVCGSLYVPLTDLLSHRLRRGTRGTREPGRASGAGAAGGERKLANGDETRGDAGDREAQRGLDRAGGDPRQVRHPIQPGPRNHAVPGRPLEEEPARRA